MSAVVSLVVLMLSAAPETADVDLARYLGTWHELARFDLFFERGCVGTTATYSLLQNGDIRILNRCFDGTLEGKEKRVTGKAWVPDKREPGKLRVQFFWPFHSAYWVLEVAPDYRWALVGNDDKSACWILSRLPALPEEEYQALVEKLRARGYDVGKLVRVPQRAAAN